MNPSQPDLPADDAAKDFRRYLERPQAWAHMSQSLQRIAMAIVGNERDAEDVVQGAWLEALERPQYEQGQGWLKRLVRFRALDVLRSKSREPIRSEEGLSDVSAQESSDMRWRLEAQREVLEAVNTLKEPYLSTVMLRYFEGKKPTEIATQLGVPVRTVKTRLTRAHEMLRARLGARYQDQFGNWAPALVAFSGYRGLKASTLTLPTAGVLLMKKATLVAVSLGLVVVLVPFALQLRGDADDGLTLSQGTEPELAELESDVVIDSRPDAQREVLAIAEEEPEQDSLAFEYAFPPRQGVATGSLSIRAAHLDGTPAGNLKLGIMHSNAEDAFLMARSFYTNAAGVLELDQLEPGSVGVGSGRTESTDVEVVAGQRTHLELEVTPGIQFEGRVLNPKGYPVAGALIFLADSAGGDVQPQASAVADNLGRYELRDVRVHHYLSARADGFAPSVQVEASGATGSTVNLDLQLREEPGAVRGRALSPKGLPVAGARIRIEVLAADDELGKDPETLLERRWPLAFELRTDEEGRFESAQVGSGRMRIKARTQTWEPWEAIVVLEPGETREVEVQFNPGYTITGSVLKENGDPIAQASVFSGRYQGAYSYKVKTNEQGQFKVHGLPPGAREFQIYKRGFAEVQTDFFLRTDTPNQVSVTLIELDSARGAVVDESGTPLPNLYVVVESGVGHWSTSALTDENGEFELLSIPDGTSDLMVTTKDFWESGSRFAVDSVLPSQGPLHIVVPDSIHPKSSVRMKILVNGKPAPVETTVKLRTASPLRHRQTYPNADGTLHMEHLAPKEFHIEVSLEGHASLYRKFQLGMEEDLDLGTLHLERGGRVHLEWDGPSNGSQAMVYVLDDQGVTLEALRLTAGEGVSGLLPAGKASLRVQPSTGATQFADAEIIAGETTSVRLTPRPGTERMIRVSRKNGKPMRNRTVVRITDAQGKVHFYAQNIRDRQKEDGQIVLELSGLERGTYQILIEDSVDDSVTVPLHVKSLDRTNEGPQEIQVGW